ncbi:MAG: Holliday junction resolvase RuvX [Chitinivibrionales bacterium]|nr:Holliday junction resolvase RuvX [Chitinivibrionales bacterium]MBD3357338.1 Holliday junction resolvase RuvX [Chitinivibrionales bacterium]
MKLLGIDYGRKRIGIAVTDPTGAVIRGLPTIEHLAAARAEDKLVKIIEEHAPDKLIFGLPLGPDDEETTMSQEVRAAASRIADRTGITVRFVDESFSSRDAELLLRTKKKKHRRNKASVDRIAACLILQSYQRDFPGDVSPHSS